MNLNTDLSRIDHPVARHLMHGLQELWRKRRGTTPYLILCEAIELLRLIPSVTGRGPDQQARALGNVGILLERARRYHVRGLKQLAIDLGSEWEAEVATDEAPPDDQGNSIDIVTVHKAKGLEWPIVIPINFVTMPDDGNDFFFRSTDHSVHWTLGDVISSTLDAAVAADRAKAADERERLLYVACTRALDLLVLPAPSWTPDGGWAKFFDLGQSRLDEIRSPPPQASRRTSVAPVNDQTADVFADEEQRIERVNPRVRWHRPSLADVDRELLDRATMDVGSDDGDLGNKAAIAGAGAARGIVLHKLMEELLTGLLQAELTDLHVRATTLVQEAIVEGTIAPDPAELAATALRTVSHRELKPYIGKLVPEIPIFGARSDTVLVSARADAVAFEQDVPIAAFDWKSDVAPTADAHEGYASQLLEYLELINIDRGAIIYMTSGEVRWVRRRPIA